MSASGVKCPECGGKLYCYEHIGANKGADDAYILRCPDCKSNFPLTVVGKAKYINEKLVGSSIQNNRYW